MECVTDMSEIQLQKRWQIGARLNGGGFGEVYLATGEAGEDAVIKLIPKAPGADRELLFESLSGSPGSFSL